MSTQQIGVVEEALIVRLTNNTAIKAIIGDRCYCGFLEITDDGPWLPAIAIELVSDTPFMCSTGEIGLTEAQLSLNLWCEESPRKAKQLKEAVRLALNGYSGQQGPLYLRAVFIDDGEDIRWESDDNENLRAYGVQVTATVYYRHTVANP